MPNDETVIKIYLSFTVGCLLLSLEFGEIMFVVLLLGLWACWIVNQLFR